MSGKIRVGIYGGTFNPPHVGHVRAAEAFAEAIKPEKLLIIPDFLPPHKELAGTVTPAQRLRMCELAFGHITGAQISDMEIKRGGRSYTAHTLEELSAEDTDLYFLCGTDMILTMDTWYMPEKIFSLATICYIRRESDEMTTGALADKTALYKEKYGAKIIPLDSSVTEISSGDIRKMLKTGDADGLVPAGVLEYISEEGLYR